MVVDAHTHVTENGKWFNTRYNASSGNFMKMMEGSSIEKAVILPINPVTSNKYVHKVCKESNGKFIGFASVHPYRNNAPAILKQDVEEFNLKGLKLHPQIQKINLTRSTVLLTIEMAMYLEIPVIIDTWYAKQRGYTKFVNHIETIITLFPGLKLILPHLGGPSPNTFYQHKNVFMDLSFILSRHAITDIAPYFTDLLDLMGPSRLIYGSDYPEMDPIKYLKRTEELMDLVGVSQADREKIFTTNILELCKVE